MLIFAAKLAKLLAESRCQLSLLNSTTNKSARSSDTEKIKMSEKLLDHCATDFFIAESHQKSVFH